MPKLIVIGAGVAGLSTAVHAARNGYDVEVLEHHDEPGGVCTAWTRGDYTIDGCIQWLIGAKPGHPMWALYEEIGATEGTTFLPVAHFNRFYDEPTSLSLSLTSDLDQMLAEVRAISPHDEPVFAKIVEAARAANLMELMPVDAPELTSLLDKIRLGWRGRKELLYMITHRSTVGTLADQVRHPVLRDFLSRMFPDIPFAFAASVLGELERGSLFTVQGGSHRFSRAIAERAKSLGVRLRYRHDVEEILVEDGRAIGVRTTDGEHHLADRVVSCAPGHTTIFRMLGGQFTSDAIRRRYAQWPLFDPIVVASFGTSGRWPELPPASQLHLERPFVIGHQEVDRISVRNYAFDPTLAPKDSTVLQVMFASDFDLWHDLHHAPRRYQALKHQVAEQVLDRLERHAPGVTARVEVTDVATPYTYWRYARSYRGAYEGFLPTEETMGRALPKTLPGLENFHMAGQWVEPGGGIPPAVYSGRQAVQLICHEDGRSFTAG